MTKINVRDIVMVKGCKRGHRRGLIGAVGEVIERCPWPGPWWFVKMAADNPDNIHQFKSQQLEVLDTLPEECPVCHRALELV